jgi:hypothetical protein
MGKFTVMGFTEAELGFVLAGTFVAVVGLQIARTSSLRTANGSLEIQLATEHMRNDSLRDVNARLQDSLTALRKKSNMIPSCAERGLGDASIATVTALPHHMFRVNGAQLSPDGLLEAFSELLHKGDSILHCKFFVELHHQAGLDPDDYVWARRFVAGRFYVRDR